MAVQREKERLTAREAAFRTLIQVEREGAYANLELNKQLRAVEISGADARLAAQICYGVVRRLYALDHILSRLLTRPLEQLMPEVRVILRLSIYQLDELDSLPDYAVVDQAVELTKRHANPTLAKLVNGVLRSYLRQDKSRLLPDRSDLARYLNITLSYPRWLADRLIADFGPAGAESFCRWQNQHPGLFLRVNSLRSDRAALLAELAEAGISAEAAGFAPETIRVTGHGDRLSRIPAFTAGRFIVQGPASQLAAHALAPAPGSRVLDLCAAPGGKTTHLAQLMQDQGDLRAFDLHPHKIKLIRDNAQRLGLTCIQAEAGNSARPEAKYHNWADFILLDAPCSGLGVLNARADSRYHKSPADIRQLAALSYQLLEAAGRCLRPGGRLLYSTCTITHEENGDNLARFLREYPAFRPLPLDNLLPLLTREEDRQAAQRGQLQLLPQIHDCEGFFLALLGREGGR